MSGNKRDTDRKHERDRRIDRDMDNREDQETSASAGVPKWAFIAGLVVILGVIAFSVFKLVRWNMGTVETEGVVEGDFEVEVLDQVFLLPEDKKAMKEDDGVETILFLGNDILTYYSDENGFVEQVAEKTGATCINGGFPSSTVAMKNAQVQDDCAIDAYSFYNVANSIVNSDFSEMERLSGQYEDYTYFLHTAYLKDTDMSKVDTLVIFYDARDYIDFRIGLNPDNEDDPVTYSGSLNAGIKMLQEKYPYIRIVCMSFPLCYAYDSTGALVSGDRYDFGNGRLTTYLQFMIDTSGATGVTFIDNYYGTIHEDNSDGWLLDNIHVNAACNEYMAEHFVSVIYDR